ncbi:hypothetical protein ANO11243_054580 [Dothideomycetidae sp. 11243]|nr:hypothetical protein ANO11243_054580 [fungal sp. No.11243]
MASNKSAAVSGSCACGAVTYVSQSLPEQVQHCNCVTCRKLSGGPFMTFGDFKAEDVRFSSGDVQVDVTSNAIEKSQGSFQAFQVSKVAIRGACKSCHSPMSMWYFHMPESIGIPLGSVDEESLADAEARRSLQAEAHIFADQRVGWYNIDKDSLPTHARFTEQWHPPGA